MADVSLPGDNRPERGKIPSECAILYRDCPQDQPNFLCNFARSADARFRFFRSIARDRARAQVSKRAIHTFNEEVLMAEVLMAKDPKPFRDLNENVEQAAEQTMKQAEGATGTYFNWLQKTMSGSPWGATDFGKKVQSYTEQNIAATQAYVQKLSQAKTVQ